MELWGDPRGEIGALGGPWGSGAVGVLVGSTVGVWGVGTGDEAQRGHIGCPWGLAAAPGVPHGRSPFAPPRKIPQTAAEGLPSPPPSGSCSPCSCCSSTPAPAGTRCPRPPAFNPRPPPSCSLSLHLHPLPRPRRDGSHLPGDPPQPRGRPPPALPTATSKEEPGCGQGPPQKKPGGRPAAPAARTRKAPALCPPTHTTSSFPPRSLAYFFSLKILNQIFLR